MAAAASGPSSAAMDGGCASPWTRSSSAAESAVALRDGGAIETAVSCELATTHVAPSEEATAIAVQHAGGKVRAAQGEAGLALDVQRASGNVLDVLSVGESARAAQNAAANERVPLHVVSAIAHDDSDVRHQSGDGSKAHGQDVQGSRDDVRRSAAKGPPVQSPALVSGPTHE